MSVGILTPGSNDPQARVWQRIAAMERRVAALERAPFTLPVKAGAPTAAEGDNGAVAGDSTNGRMWVKLNGAWRYVPVTPWP